MNEREQEQFEEKLRLVKPAPVPQALMQRLKAARPVRSAQAELVSEPVGSSSRKPGLWGFRRPSVVVYGRGIVSLWRWLVPAAALAVILATIWRSSLIPGLSPATAGSVKADDVQIDRELVSTFDAVAPMPGGEPVRFRFREWMDEVRLQDSSTGVVIEERRPRVEFVAVRFETY